MKWVYFFREDAGVLLASLLAEVNPGALVLDELAKQGVLVLILGFIIYHQHKDFTKRETDLKIKIDALNEAHLEQLREKDKKIDAYVELQSKEYRATVNILASTAEALKKAEAVFREVSPRETKEFKDALNKVLRHLNPDE